MAAKAPVNPFASAAKATKSVLKSKSPIYPAQDLIGMDGETIYTKDEVALSLNIFAEGSDEKKQAEAKMDANRPVVTAFAKHFWARDYVLGGKTPENPKVTASEAGDGVYATIGFVDKAMKLDEAQFAQMAALLGEDQATANVTRRHDFTINPDLLDDSVLVAKDGKNVKQNVMEAITEALQSKFAPSPDLLSNLFTAKEVFQTNKGLIDKALELCVEKGDKSPHAIAQVEKFVEVIRASIAIKPGGTRNDIDPLDDFSDAELEAALKKRKLRSKSKSLTPRLEQVLFSLLQSF